MAGAAEQVSRDQPGTSSAKPPIASAGGPIKAVSRSNGISFNAAPDISIHEYIKAFVSTTPANRVLSASRISNQRIAIYLNSKDDVLSAVNNGLTYNNTYIPVSPLVLPTTRLTLSNVYPEIPNDTLTKQISNFCKVVSQIRAIPLGFKDKNLAHIMSFRRHVQVLLNPNVTPPDHINFSHAGANYRVFLSTESVRCFECGETGHISRACKKAARQDGPTIDSQPPTSNKGKSDPKHPPKRSKSAQPNSSATSQHVPARENHESADPSNVGPQPKPVSNHDTIPTVEDSLTTTSQVDAPPNLPKNTNASECNNHENENPTSTPTDTPSNPSNPPKPPPVVSVWGTPPAPTRLFSEVVSKRKQPPAPSSNKTPVLVPLQSPTPPRKLQKKVSTPKMFPSPTPSQASHSAPPTPPTPASTGTIDTDATMWEDTDDDSVDWASSFPSSQGPLSDKELIKFLKTVKARKKPLDVARKFTSNIPGLVRQLRPLRNSPLFQKSTQQRIQKLVRKLEDCA